MMKSEISGMMGELRASIFAVAALGTGIFCGGAPHAYAAPGPKAGQDKVIVETEAYSWAGDTIFQGPFKAWAVGPYEIQSTYRGRPGYFMPVEQSWKRKNDLTPYPVLKGDNMLHRALYNLGLDEMVNAVEPDTTLRTGKEWAGVWTRDVSYSIILSMSALQPEASKISLLKKINEDGQIIQDTGSGGAWPISTDRMIWVVAAWEIYKVTGEKSWLETVFPVVERSLDKDSKTIWSADGLVKGETSFIDWREQSYPKWMQTVDISQSEAMGTNVLYAAALQCASQMAEVLGKRELAAEYAQKAGELAEAIERTFALPEEDYWGMYTYGGDKKLVNPRSETLGQALAILYDVASPERQKRISQGVPVTPYGPGVFYPQIADMPNYHNNALWPFVASYWGLAQAKAGNETGVNEAIGSVFRPAALFTTNKENFNLDNGDYFTELNSSNMLWSLAGNLALTNRILFGINYEKDGLRIQPFVPEAFAGTRTLENYPYRGGRLDITVKGYGSKVAEMRLDGKKIDPQDVIPAKKLSKGTHTLAVQMDNRPIPAMKVNHQQNKRAPLTPVTRLTVDLGQPMEGMTANRLEWDPIEYIGGYEVYRDGALFAKTRSTSIILPGPGEWQVKGIAGDGTESFASRVMSNRTYQDLKPVTLLNVPVNEEVAYAPQGKVRGYTGEGFAEIGRGLAALEIPVTIPEDGEYSISYVYANGNGPVNTENKAAIRTLFVDGERAGTIVMPTRGVANWDEWGSTNAVVVPLTAGEHKVTLRFQPENANMNLRTNHALVDRLHIEKR